MLLLDLCARTNVECLRVIVLFGMRGAQIANIDTHFEPKARSQSANVDQRDQKEKIVKHYSGTPAPVDIILYNLRSCLACEANRHDYPSTHYEQER